jgi:transposase-like protein
MGNELRKRRRGTWAKSGASWYVDETYLKVQGKWVYPYRAIDRDGNGSMQNGGERPRPVALDLIARG